MNCYNRANTGIGSGTLLAWRANRWEFEGSDSVWNSCDDGSVIVMNLSAGSGGGSTGGGFNWDACTPEWVGTPRNGTPYTNAAGLLCKYTGTGPGAPGTNYYYLCCPGA